MKRLILIFTVLMCAIASTGYSQSQENFFRLADELEKDITPEGLRARIRFYNKMISENSFPNKSLKAETYLRRGMAYVFYRNYDLASSDLNISASINLKLLGSKKLALEAEISRLYYNIAEATFYLARCRESTSYQANEYYLQANEYYLKAIQNHSDFNDFLESAKKQVYRHKPNEELKKYLLSKSYCEFIISEEISKNYFRPVYLDLILRYIDNKCIDCAIEIAEHVKRYFLRETVVLGSDVITLPRRDKLFYCNTAIDIDSTNGKAHYTRGWMVYGYGAYKITNELAIQMCNDFKNAIKLGYEPAKELFREAGCLTDEQIAARKLEQEKQIAKQKAEHERALAEQKAKELADKAAAAEREAANKRKRETIVSCLICKKSHSLADAYNELTATSSNSYCSEVCFKERIESCAWCGKTIKVKNMYVLHTFLNPGRNGCNGFFCIQKCYYDCVNSK